jgi:uncharacterized protein with beta-barrel porin domain
MKPLTKLFLSAGLAMMPSLLPLAAMADTNSSTITSPVSAGDLLNLGTIQVTNTATTCFSPGVTNVCAIYNPTGTASVTNAGLIAANASGVNTASAISAYNTILTNTKNLTATSIGSGFALGIDSFNASIVNSGVISAVSNSNYASGIASQGNATLVNSGVVTALSSGNNAHGMDNFGNATLVNSGTISASTSGAGWAFGFDAFGFGNVTNSGTIYASTSGSGNAAGLGIIGNATVLNSGSITAVAYGSGYASGIFTDTGSVSNITNSGTIAAMAAVPGNASALSLASNNITPNQITLLPGSKLIGQLSIGSGLNRINFQGGNHNLSFVAGNLNSASFTGSTTPWARQGDRVAAIDTTSFSANSWLLNSITREISRLTSDIDAGSASAYNPKSKASFTWVRGFGGQGNQDATDGLTLAYRNSYYGIALGLDKQLNPSFGYGIYLGSAAGQSVLATNYGETQSSLIFLGAYGRKSWGGSNFKLGLQMGLGNSNNQRNTNNNLLASGIENAFSSSQLFYVSPEASIDHVFVLGNSQTSRSTLTPYAQIRYLYGGNGGYSESGATDQLIVNAYGTQAIEEHLAIKLSHHAKTGKNSALRLDLTAGLLGAQRLGGQAVNATLLGQQIAFNQPGSASQFAGTIGLGAELTSGKISYYLGAEYIKSSNYVEDLVGRAGITLKL